MPVAGEIIVGYEKSPDPLSIVIADRLFEVVGGAKAALAALDVDDRAERALLGAATAKIEARQ
jgi:hypothetical protein